MNISTHTLPDGIALTLRAPVNSSQNPVIILCHGFCGIRDMLLPAFAEAFTRAGFSTITFDYRGFGDSQGEKGRLVPEMQIDDILSVVNWARARSGLDAQRIGLWGTSFGGCHVFGAAARDSEIACIVSQMAFADGEEVVTGMMNDIEKEAFLLTLDKMAEKQESTGRELFVSINRVLSDNESKSFFEEYRKAFPAMDIKIPFLTVRETLKYKPALNASKVVCPTLVVIAGHDTVNPPEQGRALFSAAGAKEKQLYEQKNARHYGMYTGEHFDDVIAVQLGWFRKYL